jgi:copper(I)-binding protein
MTRGARRAVRRALAVVIVALAAAGLTACTGADDRRQQRIESPVRADNVNATHGSIRLLGLRIETPADDVHVQGGNVGLFVTIANSGTAPDTLTAVSTVDARAVVYRDGAAEPGTGIRVDVPPGGVASMQYPGGPHLELVDLKRDVGGGRFMPVTFRFAEAGPVTVNVFVQGFAHPTVAPLPATSAPAASAPATP